MTDTKTSGDKTLHVSPKTLTLKRPVEQGVVRQSFSHGRTKAVVVETVKRRPIAPAAAPAAAAKPAAAKPAAPAGGANPRGGDPRRPRAACACRSAGRPGARAGCGRPGGAGADCRRSGP